MALCGRKTTSAAGAFAWPKPAGPKFIDQFLGLLLTQAKSRLNNMGLIDSAHSYRVGNCQEPFTFFKYGEVYRVAPGWFVAA